MQTKNKIRTKRMKNKTLKAINDARKGIGLSQGFSSVSELMKDLNAGK